MDELNAFAREEKIKRTAGLNTENFVPAVLYGPELKPMHLQVPAQDFIKIFRQVGENALFQLNVAGRKDKPLVLIHEVQRHPLSGGVIHVDFFQPKLTEKIEAKIPVVLTGEAPAVKELGGTLTKNLQEITVKAFPQDLPKEILLSVARLDTFGVKIFVKDIFLGAKIEILNDPDEIVAQVVPPERVEEELQKPVEEKVEEVERIEKQKKEKEEVSEEDAG